MAKTLKQIKQLAGDMIDADKGLRKAQVAYERMSRLKYTLPAPLSEWEWIRPITSAAPYNALRGATRALSNLDERLDIHPRTVMRAIGARDDLSAAAREKANEWEAALKWTLARSAKRRMAFRSSVIWSACLYHEVNAQLIHLPTEFKARDIEPARRKAALRFGDWVVRLVDPKLVHVAYSDFMPERVLAVKSRTAREITELWPAAARSITERIEGDPDYATQLYLEFDFVDYDTRCVWCAEGQHEGVVADKGLTLLKPQPWLLDQSGDPVPFLPWLCVAGGSDIDAAPEHQRKPILYPVLMAEEWAAANIFGTILMSLATAEAAQPREAITGPGGEDVDVDYTHPGGRITLTAAQKYQQLQRLGLDPAMREAFDRIEGAMRTSTVAEVLVTGQPAGGVEAFAGYNLQVLQAIASLGDFKQLGEAFYERLYEAILLVTHYTGGEISGFGKGLDKYTIDSEDIDPEAIEIRVELTPDVPVDRVQRIAAGVQMSTQLPYAPQKVLEFLGETDPEGAVKLWKLWQLDLADFRGRLQRVQMEASGEIDALVAQRAQGMIAEAQQAGPAQPPSMAGQVPGPTAPMGVQGIEGQVFNPNVMQGGLGMPPAMAAPEATRERQAV